MSESVLSVDVGNDRRPPVGAWDVPVPPTPAHPSEYERDGGDREPGPAWTVTAMFAGGAVATAAGAAVSWWASPASQWAVVGHDVLTFGLAFLGVLALAAVHGAIVGGRAADLPEEPF